MVTAAGLAAGEGSAWGALPFGAGVALRLMAIRRLGSRFTHGVELVPGHRLETQGVYRWMHHPSEIGLLLVGLGTGLLLGSVSWVPLMLLPMALRVHAEERLLAELR